MPYENALYFQPMQVLAIDCPIVRGHDPQMAWLQAYVLLTMQVTPDDVQLTGTAVVGERYIDEVRLITDLEEALDPGALLAGSDLTGMMTNLGCLPIEAANQAPALALLDKLEAMLARPPIDITIDRQLEEACTRNVRAQRMYAVSRASNRTVCQGPDSINPAMMVAHLARMAGGAALAIADVCFEPELHQQAVAAWHRWRDALFAQWQLLPATVTGTSGA